MGTDVDQWTAALLLLVQKYAPSRHRPAAKRQRLAEINVPEFAIFAQLFQVQAIVAEAVLVSDRQLFARAFGRIEHLTSLLSRFGHRLLAHHMAAGFQRSDRDFRVGVIRRADMHDFGIAFR
ncbi:hypothetical protein D3C81_1075300 [compost metagenome]